MSIQLHIDELRLVGFRLTPLQRDALRDNMVQALESMLVDGGVPPSWGTGAVAALAAEPMSLPTNATPADTGRAIAAALYQAETP